MTETDSGLASSEIEKKLARKRLELQQLDWELLEMCYSSTTT